MAWFHIQFENPLLELNLEFFYVDVFKMHSPKGTLAPFLRLTETEIGKMAAPEVDDGEGEDESQEPSSDWAGVGTVLM